MELEVLRDKEDDRKGLFKQEGKTKQITVHEHIIQVDTRDCVGVDTSLIEAKTAFQANGGRNEANGIITFVTGTGVSPVKIGTNNISGILQNGDTITISGVQGNTSINGTWSIQNVLDPDPDPSYQASFEISSVISNGNYAGGGMWIRKADNGFPNINESGCKISGNEMTILLQKKVKALRSFKLNWASIPRDIIPIEIYFKDLYSKSTHLVNQSTNTPFEIWDTFIPQEEKFMVENSIGFFSTPIRLFRSYDGSLAMPNQVTPPPLKLWNPTVGVWPDQPRPYPYQTVPTYRSNNFTVTGTLGNFYLICSGYGIYDLLDWTSSTGNAIYDRLITEIARKLLLLVIIRPQMLNDIDYVEMILNSTTTSSNVSPFGYGDFQRFLPGPGIQLNYQPGISDGANPTGPADPVNYPVIFPEFLGNVWGPYDTPGDRFQKIGVRDTIQDLFLNGDLDNLLGEPIIKPWVARENLMSDPTFGINFTSLQEITFDNIRHSTNPNILNSMRIVQNGFGALNIRALGGGTYYTDRYFSSGGIGPSSLGLNGAWSLTGVYGVPDIDDPNAVGPQSVALLVNGEIPQGAEGDDPNNYVNQTSQINHRISWYDKGANEGELINQLSSYVRYVLTQVGDTNIVIHAFQVPRDHRVQSTNSKAGDSIFNVPLRLTLGTLTGNFAYMEGIYSLISDTDFWERRFLTPLGTLDKLNLTFSTYEGTSIPLERMLQYDRSSVFLESLERVFGSRTGTILSSIIDVNSGLSFLYDPLNPRLIRRTKRFISLIFRAECYQYINSGLNIEEKINEILGKVDEDEDEEFNVRASNYQEYT